MNTEPVTCPRCGHPVLVAELLAYGCCENCYADRLYTVYGTGQGLRVAGVHKGVQTDTQAKSPREAH